MISCMLWELSGGQSVRSHLIAMELEMESRDVNKTVLEYRLASVSDMVYYLDTSPNVIPLTTMDNIPLARLNFLVI